MSVPVCQPTPPAYTKIEILSSDKMWHMYDTPARPVLSHSLSPDQSAVIRSLRFSQLY